jgi:hypothetical protein
MRFVVLPRVTSRLSPFAYLTNNWLPDSIYRLATAAGDAVRKLSSITGGSMQIWCAVKMFQVCKKLLMWSASPATLTHPPHNYII